VKWTSVSPCAAGQDLNLNMDRLASNRNFTNKIWNAGGACIQVPFPAQLKLWCPLWNHSGYPGSERRKQQVCMGTPLHYEVYIQCGSDYSPLSPRNRWSIYSRMATGSDSRRVGRWDL